MSKLGGDGFNLRRRPKLQLSTLRSKLPKFNLRNSMITLVVLFIVRNLLKNDYRKEEMKYLRDPAMQAKEIEKAIHGSEQDRYKFLNSRGKDVERLKQDIIYLLGEVKTLRTAARDPNSSMSGRDSDLKEMDKLHMEKRQAREEQLLKEHPDFKPSRRVKDGDIAATT